MSDRPWPKTARTLRTVGIVTATVGLLVIIVPWALFLRPAFTVEGVMLLIAGGALVVHATTYRPRDNRDDEIA